MEKQRKKQLEDLLYSIEQRFGLGLAWSASCSIYFTFTEIYWVGLLCFSVTLAIISKWSTLVIKTFLKGI